MTKCKKTIYPVFMPHAGCPFQCVYCNQHVVAGNGDKQADLLDAARSRLKLYDEHVRRSKRPGEIAFFGGTFTALPQNLMESILDSASSLVRSGTFTGIRFSTRPDCLGVDVVQLLAKYPIRTVELGVQSISDEVLSATRRGYSTRTVYKSAKLVKEQKWDLGIQLMAGLPADNPERFMESVRRAVAIRPDFLRIYPTLVLEGTGLAESFRRGEYVALSLDEAIEWLVPAYDLLLKEGIPVVRMGLHSDPALERTGVVLAGPYHPAFGYLVRCRWWRDRLDEKFAAIPGIGGGELALRIPANIVSDVIGPKRSNLEHWESKWRINLKICADPALIGIEMLLDLHK